MRFLFHTLVYLNKKGEKKTTKELMVFVVMAIIIMLFQPLIIALLLNRRAAHIALPKEFALSTLVLIGATWLLQYTRRYKESDQYRRLRKTVITLFLLTAAFLLFQAWGSRKIFTLVQYKEVKIVALIAIYHALQLCIAAGAFVKLFVSTRAIRSASDWYIYFLKPAHHFAFKHSLLYWNFFCGLWVALYVLMILKFA